MVWSHSWSGDAIKSLILWLSFWHVGENQPQVGGMWGKKTLDNGEDGRDKNWFNSHTVSSLLLAWEESKAELDTILGAFSSPEERCTAERKVKPGAVELGLLALSVSLVLPQTPVFNPPQTISFVASQCLSAFPKPRESHIKDAEFTGQSCAELHQVQFIFIINLVGFFHEWLQKKIRFLFVHNVIPLMLGPFHPFLLSLSIVWITQLFVPYFICLLLHILWHHQACQKSLG